MDCQQCLEENKRSIAEKGYGYGYIGKNLNCKRHKNPLSENSDYLLKWTDGLPHEKSRRMKHQIQIESEEFSKNMEKTAYTSSLHHDENTWDILNQTHSESGFKISNKREELGDKMANRDMIQQIGFNPFLSQTNYVDDISIRDQFLKPMNTTQGEKNLS